MTMVPCVSCHGNTQRRNLPNSCNWDDHSYNLSIFRVYGFLRKNARFRNSSLHPCRSGEKSLYCASIRLWNVGGLYYPIIAAAHSHLRELVIEHAYRQNIDWGVVPQRCDRQTGYRIFLRASFSPSPLDITLCRQANLGHNIA